MSKPPIIQIDVDNGKYTVIQEADGSLRALRYGEAWRDLCGDNMVLAMAFEIAELRTKITELEKPEEPARFPPDKNVHIALGPGSWKDNED